MLTVAVKCKSRLTQSHHSDHPGSQLQILFMSVQYIGGKTVTGLKTSLCVVSCVSQKILANFLQTVIHNTCSL